MRLRFSCVGVAAVLAGGLFAACGEQPPSPSLVKGLRVMGLRADPPAPARGQSVRLELQWTDSQPFCASADACEEGRSCVDGRCVRDAPTQIAWLALPLAAFAAADELPLTETGGEVTCLIDRCPPPTLCETSDDCPFDGQCVEGSCVPCFTFESVTFCCGDASLEQIVVPIPEELPVPEATCDDTTFFDLAQLLHVQVQICAGGELDLCAEPEARAFACVGEGAQSLSVQTRIPIGNENTWPNDHPAFDSVEVAGTESQDGGIIEIGGCLESGCSDKRCASSEECDDGFVCHDGICKSEIVVALGEGSTETFLNECDEQSSCADDGDCERSWVCVEGQCRRIESPLVSFYATAGGFSSGRGQLDTSGDGRPNESQVETFWSTPVLDPCTDVSDACSFGLCDPTLGRCVGDVDFWVVARDNRGGQSWIEQTLRIRP